MEQNQFSKIAEKWQKLWKQKKIYKTKIDLNKKKIFIPPQFPYPSGEGLHVGHTKVYSAAECVVRKKMLEGYSCLHPMGWDAFGLPAENYAIKNKIHPQVAVDKNISNFKEQLDKFGGSYDRDDEVNTTDPKYFKWTQRIFLKLYDHFFDEKDQVAKHISKLQIPDGLNEIQKQKFIDSQRLAYMDFKPINWCPSCKTGLANEDLEDGKCERCSSEIEQKPMKQWILRITKYTKRLLNGIDNFNRTNGMKELEKNWIGKSSGTQFCMFTKDKSINKIFILHGFGSDANSNWFNFIKENLTKIGYEVYIPNLTDSYNPDINQHIDQLIGEYGNIIDEKTIIIGHSLGFYLANQLLIILGKKINKLIGVAPVYHGMNFSKLEKNEYFLKDGNIKKIKNYISEKENFQTIISLCNEFNVYLSKDDEFIEYEEAKNYFENNIKNLKIKEYENKGHFNSGSGITKFYEILFDLCLNIELFTTRIDTVFGVSYLALSPQSNLIEKIVDTQNIEKINEYIKNLKIIDTKKDQKKDKSGIFSGSYALNPFNMEIIPIYISDYVLGDYGTGALMGVPAHDERDYEFAKKYGLKIKNVIIREFGEKNENEKIVEGICCIIFDEKTGKIGCLKNKDTGGFWLITGGKENGENIENTLIREIEEETGFNDIKKIIHITKYVSHYFHPLKKIYNKGIVDTYIVMLNSENKSNNQKKEEHEKVFDFNWIEFDQLYDFISNKDNKKLNSRRIYFLQCSYNKLKQLGYQINYNNLDNIEIGYFENKGKLMSSGEFDGLNTDDAIQKMQEWLIKNGIGKEKINYKLQDWVFSRQRYWGEPIPMIHCSKCGVLPVDEKDLPIELPKVDNYEPTGNEEGPLANIKDFVNIICTKCKGPAKRETNTMPQWAGSSRYWIRYKDAKNDLELVDKEKDKYRGAVDIYIGGVEHVTRHMIYARFWNMFLYDIGIILNEEPFPRFEQVGLVLAKDGKKMSKRYGNVINPIEIIEKYGPDTLRTYQLFMGPYDQMVSRNDESLKGVHRFLERVYNLKNKIDKNTKDSKQIEILLNKTIKKVGDDIEKFKFNTAISALMILVNELTSCEKISKQLFESFVLILSPFAPHIAEELWEIVGNKFSIFTNGKWPKYDESQIEDDLINLAVQINGKTRGTIETKKDDNENTILENIKKDEKLSKYFQGTIKKTIFVPGKIINIII